MCAGKHSEDGEEKAKSDLRVYAYIVCKRTADRVRRQDLDADKSKAAVTFASALLCSVLCYSGDIGTLGGKFCTFECRVRADTAGAVPGRGRKTRCCCCCCCLRRPTKRRTWRHAWAPAPGPPSPRRSSRRRPTTRRTGSCLCPRRCRIASCRRARRPAASRPRTGRWARRMFAGGVNKAWQETKRGGGREGTGGDDLGFKCARKLPL